MLPEPLPAAVAFDVEVRVEDTGHADTPPAVIARYALLPVLKQNFEEPPNRMQIDTYKWGMCKILCYINAKYVNRYELLSRYRRMT